jgi:hypothetical protein
MSWSSIVQALKEAYDSVSQASEWYFWTQDVMLAIQQKKAPPPSPLSTKLFESKLEDDQLRLSKLAKPTFEAALPEKGAVPTTGFDVTRSAIRLRMRALENCVSEVSDGRSAIRYFKRIEAQLETQQNMLGRLQGELLNLAHDYPLPFLFEQLLINSTSIDYSYLPTVKATSQIVETKRKSAEATLAMRLTLLKASANEIKNILIVEAVDLKVQVQRLQDLDNEVGRLQEKLVQAVEARDKAAADEKQSKTIMDAATLDVQVTEGRLSDA